MAIRYGPVSILLLILAMAAGAIGTWVVMRPSSQTQALDRRRMNVFLDEREIERHRIDLEINGEADAWIAEAGLGTATGQYRLSVMRAKIMRAKMAMFNELEDQDDAQIKLAIHRGDSIASITEKYQGQQQKNKALAMRDK